MELFPDHVPALAVSAYLPLPVQRVALRGLEVQRAGVPEAAVDEDRQLPALVGDVGRPGKRPVMNAVAASPPPELAADEHLGAGVLAPYPRHDL